MAPGEVLGLVGPNGAGKTTTLRCLAGIIPPTAGQCANRAASTCRATRSRPSAQLAFFPDEPRLFDYLTVRSTWTFTARIYGVAGLGGARGQPLLEELELADKADRLPGELSRGMKQKLAIACGLLHAPRLISSTSRSPASIRFGIRRMKDSILRARAAARRIVAQLAPAAPGRGAVPPHARHRRRQARRVRDAGGDPRPARAGGGEAARSRSCSCASPRRRAARELARAVAFLYLPTARNRLRRQDCGGSPSPSTWPARSRVRPTCTRCSCAGWTSPAPGPASRPARACWWSCCTAARPSRWPAPGAWARIAPLTFTEAEVQLLFPAPVSRRGLVQYRAARGLVRAGLSALLTTLFFGRNVASHAGFFLVGSFLSLGTLQLHAAAASLVRTRLAARGRAWLRWGLLALLGLAAALALLLALRVHPFPGVGSGPRALQAWLGALAASPALHGALAPPGAGGARAGGGPGPLPAHAAARGGTAARALGVAGAHGRALRGGRGRRRRGPGAQGGGRRSGPRPGDPEPRPLPAAARRTSRGGPAVEEPHRRAQAGRLHLPGHHAWPGGGAGGRHRGLLRRRLHGPPRLRGGGVRGARRLPRGAGAGQPAGGPAWICPSWSCCARCRCGARRWWPADLLAPGLLLAFLQGTLLLLAFALSAGEHIPGLPLAQRAAATLALLPLLPAISLAGLLVQNVAAVLFPSWLPRHHPRAGGARARHRGLRPAPADAGRDPPGAGGGAAAGGRPGARAGVGAEGLLGPWALVPAGAAAAARCCWGRWRWGCSPWEGPSTGWTCPVSR